SPPPPPAVRADSALLDTLDVDAISVVVIPGITRQALDSIPRVLEPVRRDITPIVVAIGYRGTILPELKRAEFDENGRLATLRRVMERAQPGHNFAGRDPYITRG